MKKIATFIMLAAVMMTSVAVNAAKLSVYQENGRIKVTVDTENNERDIPVLIKAANDNGDIFYLDEYYTDERGIYLTDFGAGRAEGVVVIYASVGGIAIDNKKITVRTSGIENECVTALTAGSKSQIEAAMQKHRDALELDEGLYGTLGKKNDVIERMAADTGNRRVTDYAGFSAAFYRAVILQKYSELENKNDICSLMLDTVYKKAFGEFFADNYNELADEIKKYVTNGMKADYDTADSFLNDIEFSVLSTAVRYSAVWANVKSFVERYSKKIGLETNPTAEQYKEIFGNSYSSYSEIKSALEEEASGRGGSSGGGGGGSGGYATTPTNPAIQQPSVPDTSKTGTPIFADMDTYAWADEAVSHIYELGIISGDGSGNFEPGRTVTRAEAVKMLVSLLGRDISLAPDYLPFTDMKKDSWAFPYIATAYVGKIAAGRSDTYFGANEGVTRQEMAVMMWNTMKIMEFKEMSRLEFADSDEIADWAKDAVEILGGMQIIHGRNVDGFMNFDPNSMLSRAEAAVIISNAAKLKR